MHLLRLTVTTALAVAASAAPLLPPAGAGARVAAPAAAAQQSPSASPSPGGTVAEQPSPTSVTPSPSATPRPGCGAPPMQSIDVQPARVAAGDTATVTVRVRDEPCYSDERSPHGVSLFASRGSDGARALVARGTTDAGGFFVFAERVTESTTYDFSGAGQGRLGGTTTRLTVDRVSGSCTGTLTLSAPATVDTGQTVTVTGTSSDTATVSISFRRRGQTAFSARRAGLQPTGLQGSFGTTFRADDDYRLFASNERCDSDVVLTQAAPVLLGGPARVRKGSVVPLTVRATQGTALSVAFRRSGQTAFTVRRNGTADSRGVYTTTYLADADYEYVAAERAGQRSAPRTTQAR